MPFTLAHPAAALIVPKWWGLERSALVVGSMSPDFIYFLRLRPAGDFGHTLPGLLLFCLPAGFVVFWLFHGLLRDPLDDLLSYRAPGTGHEAPSRLKKWPFAVIALSLLVGALTHIAWDAFTHESGWGVAQLPWLQTTLWPQRVAIPVYKLAQHGSSLVGLAAIVAGYGRHVYTARRSARPGWPQLGLGLLFLGSSGAVGFLYSLARHPATLSTFLGTFVVTTLSSLFIALCLWALGWHARNLKR